MDFDFAQLRQDFGAETEEDLATVEEALLKLERSPGDAECVATVFRKFHTLKGNALSLELVHLGEFAHRIEDLLDRLRSGSAPVTPALVTYLLQAVDLIRTLLRLCIDCDRHQCVARVSAFSSRRRDATMWRSSPESRIPSPIS